MHKRHYIFNAMKVTKSIKKIRSVTLRIADETMKKVDDLAATNGTSRQDLIEKIIEAAIADPEFEIELFTYEEV